MLYICLNVLFVEKTKSVIIKSTLVNGEVPSHAYKAKGNH